MLLQNSTLLAQYPISRTGGTLAGESIGIGLTDHTFLGLYSCFDAKASVPEGYVPGSGDWYPAKSPGGLAISRGAMQGAGETEANVAGGRNALAALTGEGDIDQAALGLILSAVASLTGSGVLAASILGKLEAVAALTGTSVTSAAMGALAGLQILVTGSGDVDEAGLQAKAHLSSDLVVTGDLLNSANVGAAVWQELLEEGFSASQILRVVAAAVAGKSTGGPDSPVFRNLSDTQNQLSGDADVNGNRSNVTYGD